MKNLKFQGTYENDQRHGKAILHISKNGKDFEPSLDQIWVNGELKNSVRHGDEMKEHDTKLEREDINQSFQEYEGILDIYLIYLTKCLFVGTVVRSLF